MSAAAIARIRREEGFHDGPYTNLVGQLAISYGHTYDVKPDTTTNYRGAG